MKKFIAAVLALLLLSATVLGQNLPASPARLLSASCCPGSGKGVQ